MKDQIEAILAPARAAGLKVTADKNKRYWAIHVNGHAGARADGVSLARDLMRDAIKPPPPPKPVPQPERSDPMPVGEMEIPEEIEIPRFLAPDPLEDVPASLQHLAEPDETVHEMQARMWTLWLELNGKLMLGLATPEETSLHSRLHNELHWFAPPIEGE
jgi:hypothetical protein